MATKVVRVIGKIARGRLTIYWQLSNGLIFAKSVPIRRRG